MIYPKDKPMNQANPVRIIPQVFFQTEVGREKTLLQIVMIWAKSCQKS